MTIPPIDRGEADRFLQLLGKTPATARLRLFPHRANPNRADIKARSIPYDLLAADRFTQEGRGCYLVIGNGGDRDATITSCPALFLEWDDHPIAWQLQAWQQFGLGEPTCSIVTGGKSAHLYWVLDSPLAPEEWIPLQSALISLTGADTTNRNPSRVMRLPGAHYIDATGQAIGQTRIHSAPGHRYSAEQVTAWLLAAAPQQQQEAPRQRISLADGQSAAPSGDLPPRPPEALRRALESIPPFTHGADQYQLLLGLALRLHVEIGSVEAQQLLAETCCQAITDLPSYFGERPTAIHPGSVWPYLRQHWGVHIGREDLRGKHPGADHHHHHHQQQEGGGGEAASDEPCTYRELLATVLAAIREGDDDGEMAARSEIMGRFRRTDGQIGAALFRLLTEHEQRAAGTAPAERPGYRSIDLSKVVGIDWLLEGFLPANDQALLYAPAGAGKTTAALGMAFAVIEGTGFLDRDAVPLSGSVLVIAADSGPAPLIRTLQDLGRIDHPALSAAHSGHRLHVWAHDPDQAALGWDASLRGCLALLEFVRTNRIRLVIIDSCKAVTSRADVNYCDNAQVTALLTFMKEVVCRFCSVLWLNHDGTGGGEAAGAKAWKEIPSAVHAIELVPEGEDPEAQGKGGKGKRVRYSTKLRSWIVRKCRQGTAREFMYEVHEDSGALRVTGPTEIIRDVRHGIGLLLWRALAEGKASMHRRDIFSELGRLQGYSRGTVANSLTRSSGGRRPMVARVPSMPGHWRLTPLARQWLEANEGESPPP